MDKPSGTNQTEPTAPPVSLPLVLWGSVLVGWKMSPGLRGVNVDPKYPPDEEPGDFTDEEDEDD